MVDDKLKTILVRNGLTEKQALVYLSFLEGGRLTITQAAAISGIKRSITYKVVESLIKEGYASEVLGEKVKVFKANDPARILRMVENDVGDLKFFMPMLQGVFQRHDPKPRVEFCDGKEGVKSIFDTFGLAKKAKYISSYSKLTKEFPREVERWMRSAEANKINAYTQQLIADEPEGRLFAQRVSVNPAWNIRILPNDFEVNVDFGVIDERTVALVGFNPIFIVLIHSEAIAKFFSQIFDSIWRDAKRFRHKK